MHPILEDPLAGLALIVSAVALIGSGLFPYFIARLMNRDPESSRDGFWAVRPTDRSAQFRNPRSRGRIAAAVRGRALTPDSASRMSMMAE